MNPQHLASQLLQANQAYAAGMPYMTDTEYDTIWRELASLDPHHPGLWHTSRHPSKGANTYQHTIPIKGTMKAFCQEDLKPFLMRHGTQPVVLEPKYDGCAAVLYRMSADKLALLTEGDGMFGRDISYHLPKLILPPKILAYNSIELIIPRAKWKPEYGRNPRNTVAGWVNRLEPNYPTALVEAISHAHGPLSHECTLPQSYDAIEELLLEKYHEWNKLYPLDGIMIKIADHEQRLTIGDNGTWYEWSIAWKPPITTKETTVTGVEWTVSRTGRVVPTVLYSPVDICSTTNTRATGNNAAWLTTKGITPGCTIVIGKAGEIIPKIVSVTDPQEPSLPTECPMCQAPLEQVGRDLVCSGPECLSQLHSKLTYFYSDHGVDLQGVGPALLGKLLDDPYMLEALQARPWLLLGPTGQELSQLIHLWSPGPVTAYRSGLSTLRGTIHIGHFITAMGYPKLGYRTVMSLLHYVKNGIKPRSRMNKAAIPYIVDGIKQYMEAEAALVGFQFADFPQSPVAYYCITGTLTVDRQTMIDYLTAHKWQYINTVTKALDYLILGDKPGKVKQRLATEYRIKTLREDELEQLLHKQEDTPDESNS